MNAAEKKARSREVLEDNKRLWKAAKPVITECASSPVSLILFSACLMHLATKLLTEANIDVSEADVMAIQQDFIDQVGMQDSVSELGIAINVSAKGEA